MSMLDAFFNKGGFKGPKCKTLLKLTIPRIKLLRNRREIQLKQMRKDIAKLLENGQEATARIRVEHIIREENMMAAQEIIELFCELIAVRLPIIETQRECPLDLKEAISSVCFAAPRCSDLTELQQVQMLFAAKYGKEFVAAATELMPNCGVNRQIIELLSVRAPSAEAKLKLLKEIAEEHELEWDPADSETEYLKPHEDLLNGPNHIISGSTLPLPTEKLTDSISSKHTEENEELDSDPGFDSLDLPEVPKVSVRTTADSPSTPDIFPAPVKHSSPPLPDFDYENIKSTPNSDEEPKEDNPDPSISIRENRQVQFIPFDFPATLSSRSKQSDQTPFVASPPSEHNDPIFESLPHDPSSPSPLSPSKHNKTGATVDLQDVLAAAHAAAESAERAAASARAAASLAQVRISELVTKRNDRRGTDVIAKDGSPQSSDPEGVTVNPTYDLRGSFGHTNHDTDYEPTWGSGAPAFFTDDVPKMADGSLGMKEQSHQPQRSTSLEDDPYFSYPNLFSRQDSGSKPGSYSSTEHLRPPHEY